MEIDDDKLHKVINILLKAYFGVSGYEWISWWIYDNNCGEKGLEAKENGKPICYNTKSLWEHVEKLRV